MSSRPTLACRKSAHTHRASEVSLRRKNSCSNNNLMKDFERQYVTKNLWFSCRRGAKDVQNFSMSELISPDPPITSMNFFLSGESFMATCNLKCMLKISGCPRFFFFINCSGNLQSKISSKTYLYLISNRKIFFG